MRIHISYSPSRPKPAVGDRKMIRGVEHVRVLELVKDGPYKGAHVVKGNRPCYEWVPLDEAPEYLRNKPGRWVGKPVTTQQQEGGK